MLPRSSPVPARGGRACAPARWGSLDPPEPRKLIVEYDVTSLVTGTGTFTFALIPTSSSGFGVSSREGATPPQLIIQ